MINKIAIQGISGSFHQEAAEKFFGKDIEIIECRNFQEVFDVMDQKIADLAVLAIENSVAGSILPNYARLRDSSLSIIGEIYLRIEMNLMALEGEEINSLNEVHSHPMAILQASKFFREHPNITLVESDDTAASARETAQLKIKGRGALASRQAAKMYGLKILAESIETNKRNFTRFLVLADKASEKPINTPTKASWSFRTEHRSGSLANALKALSYYNINLTKIQSMPVLGEEWKYHFYADLEFDDLSAYTSAKESVKPFIYDLRILGEYKQGEKYL